MLSWDCNLLGETVQSGYANTYGNNLALELLSTNKDIKIYIEKKFFEQESFGTNPFDIIIKQQSYEVASYPRNCTTLTTDYNIYSSKIIWADNIMTMRKDLNAVGGTVDTLVF